LRRRSGIEDAAKAARRLKWRWGGHVVKMDQERWEYATTVWDPRIGRRNRGRPRRRWDHEFREVVGNQWSRIARDILRYKLKGKTESDGKLHILNNSNNTE
jgi:hypothetical protein